MVGGEVWAWVVRALHVALVAFFVWAPFSRSDAALALHFVSMPFLWLHWVLNDDTCALTILESKLRGVPASRSFFHSIVSPVYKIRDEHVRLIAWGASVGLWLVTASRVCADPGILRRAIWPA
jgi:hypothetical protein